LGELVDVLSEEMRKGHTRLVLVALPEGPTRPIDTLIAIATAIDVPILAVPRDQQRLPRRVLVATDFSTASARAARAAVSLLGPGGHLSLLHVEPEIDYEAVGHPAWRHASADGIAGLFDELRHELDEEARRSSVPRRRTSIVKDTVLLHGEPAPTILEHAARHRNDLIVVGTRGVRAGDTMPLGSVSLAILRGARCAVLVAPPHASRQVASPLAAGFEASRSAT
jgi:nucleotide-binding universal stress UspA family protein